MSKKRASDNISLTAFDDLFGAPMEGEQIVEVPLNELFEFSGHPFRILDDEKMEETVASVKKQGIIVPGIVRPRSEGGYEIIAGHRRRRAAELAGLKTMPVYIRDYSDEQATCLMVDTNIQREDILPSEKARAYRMKYDKIKSPGVKGNSLDELGNAAGESGKTVQRYLWLSNLIPELMELVDTRKIGMAQGIDLSFLGVEEQNWVLDIRNNIGASISMAQSAKIKELYKQGELTRMAIQLILEDIKPKARKFVLKADKISEFFPEEMTDKDIENTILNLLEKWKSENN
ncbi:MAG: ParB/RepB/Spo0J family partition protein [Lachnospiraceae bacterium]|nr:ParB/RepB/Spo0J family partition protein [Lachnospiraceae bacterium]